MNLVFIFPFCSPDVNSISGGPIYIGTTEHNVLIVTAQAANALKGDVTAPPSEFVGDTEFYRPYPHSRDIYADCKACRQDVDKKIRAFNPDIIIGFGEFNFRLPLRLSRELSLPLYLYMEYLRPEKIAIPLRGRSHLCKILPAVHDWLANRYLKYLTKNTEAIMYAYFGDKTLEKKIADYGGQAHYVPWCTEVGVPDEAITRKRKTGIYIGSLEGFKNSAELVKAIPVILDRTDTEQFIVVGPGSYAPQIKQLVEQYGERLIYIESVPREEAMRLICAAGYGYTPVTDCGLGFIGDCWGTGTPLIATHELEGFLEKGVDTIVADGYLDLPRVINALLASDNQFTHYQQHAKARYNKDYTAEAVGKKYLDIFKG